MGVDALSKIEEAMLAEIGGMASNRVLLDQRIRYAILVREYVDIEPHRIDKLKNKDIWDAAVYLYELCVH